MIEKFFILHKGNTLTCPRYENSKPKENFLEKIIDMQCLYILTINHKTSHHIPGEAVYSYSLSQ
jgi:hypothetical protein